MSQFVVSGEEIPTGYSSNDLEPADLSLETKKFGPAVRSDDFQETPGVPIFSTQLTPDQNDLALLAFRQANAKYAAMTTDEKAGTTAGALAVIIHGQLMAERQKEKETVVNSQEKAARILAKVNARAGVKTEPASEPATVKRVATPETLSAPRAKSFANVPSSAIKPKRSEIECLGIDSLSTEPADPSLVCRLRWQHHGDLGVLEFVAHWGDVYPQPPSAPGALPSHLVVLTLDGRDSDAVGLFDLTDFVYDASQTMTLTVETDGNNLEFQVAQVITLHEFGVFKHIQFYQPANTR